MFLFRENKNNEGQLLALVRRYKLHDPWATHSTNMYTVLIFPNMVLVSVEETYKIIQCPSPQGIQHEGS